MDDKNVVPNRLRIDPSAEMDRSRSAGSWMLIGCGVVLAYVFGAAVWFLTKPSGIAVADAAAKEASGDSIRRAGNAVGYADDRTVPLYRYEIVRTYPHDSTAFTQGLFYLAGSLYGSTGLVSRSLIRRVELRTGRVLQNTAIAAPYFGEGIVNWRDRLISLTWQHHIGWVFDLQKLTLRSEFHHAGEGWGLTQDGRQLIMSDGTSMLRLIDPDTLRQTGEIDVTYEGKPLVNLNELEWIKGQSLRSG